MGLFFWDEGLGLELGNLNVVFMLILVVSMQRLDLFFRVSINFLEIYISVKLFEGMRQRYHSTGSCFDECDLVSQEPFGNFQHWFEEACKEPRILEPNAMALATATKLATLPFI